MKINLNLLTEQKSLSISNIESQITYSDSFDEDVKLLNSKKTSSSRVGTLKKVKVPQRSSFEVNAVPTADLPTAPEESPSETSGQKIFKTQKYTFPEKFTNETELSEISTAPDYRIKPFNGISVKGVDSKKQDLYYVNYKFVAGEGTIINSPEKGYLVSKYKISNEERDAFLKTISNNKNLNNISNKNIFFAPTFKEARKILLALNDSKLDVGDLDEDPYFNDQKTRRGFAKPDNFKDYIEKTPDNQTSPKPQKSEEAKAKTDKDRIKFTNKRARDNFRSAALAIAKNKKNIKISDDFNPLTLKSPILKNLYLNTNKQIIKDIASLAAMLVVETVWGNSKYSPNGVITVAFTRVQDRSYPSDLYKVVSGPGYLPDRSGSSWKEKRERWNNWNNSDDYIEGFKMHFEQIESILTAEIYGNIVNKKNQTLITPEEAKKVLGHVKKLNDNKKSKKKTIDKYYKNINLAISAFENKQSIVNKYKNAISFIHPGGMTRKTPKERNRPKSALKYPYDFKNQTLYKLENPGKDNEKLDLQSGKKFKIKGYKKQIHGKYGIRYLPLWMIKSIRQNKAYFIEGEEALFSNLK